MGDLSQAMDHALGATADRLLAYLPQLLGALALLGVGWVLARLLRLLAWRGVTLLDSLLARRGAAPRWRVGRSAVLLGTIVYWVVLLAFIAAATQTLGLESFTQGLGRLLEHLPNLAAGLLIIVAGYVLSGFVSELVQAAATALAAPQRLALGRSAQAAVLVIALLVGGDQIGLKVTWIAIFAALVLAAVMGGAALAVSLGARSHVANLLGAHYLRQALRPGQRVRVAGHEGRIVDISTTSLVLETADGSVMLPGSVYHEQAIVVVARSDVA